MTKSGTDQLIHAELPGCDGRIVCATTTRPFSRGVETKAENASRLAESLLGDATAWVGGRQCHGADVQIVDDATIERPHWFDDRDGLATTRRGVLLCCFTADCVPVVVADAAHGVVGIAHAGWRGTPAEIARGLVNVMAGLGANTRTMSAWIGPAISGAAYEVSEELAAEFAAAFPDYANEVVRGRYLDLPKLNALQLGAAGLDAERIVVSDLCTLSDEQRFFSYRRDGTCGTHLVTAVGLLA